MPLRCRRHLLALYKSSDNAAVCVSAASACGENYASFECFFHFTTILSYSEIKSYRRAAS